MSKTKTPAELTAEERYPDWHEDDFVRGAKNGFVSGYNAALQTLQWRKIDKDNLPEGEVLCIGLINDEVYTGRIRVINRDGRQIVVCDDTVNIRITPQYYIPLSDILNLPKQQ